MAKKLIDIQKRIALEEIVFKDYLQNALDEDVVSFVERLSEVSRVYIFSGIIRNYFLKIKENRDLDIVIDGEVNMEEIISKYEYRKNSFGGYKIKINNTEIDLWFLHNTWALNYQKMMNFDVDKYLPSTAFFNFSAILFSYNEDKFFYSKDFVRFLRDKKIDMVYAPNANESLCVTNSIYYSDKFKLKLGDKLKKYLKKIFKKNIGTYESIQLKHFGKILYSEKDLEERINNL